MTREEAILHFNENYVKNALEKNSQKFNKIFEENKVWLEKTLIKAMKDICAILGQKNFNHGYRIKYFNFSLLRTSIISKEYRVLVSAYDESWYLDDYATHLTIDVSLIFNVLNELEEELKKKKKVYVNKIQNFHIREIMFKQAFNYYTSIELFASKVFQNIDEELWFKDINKPEQYCIRWGEYRDLTHIVYQMDEAKKTQEDFLKAIKEIENNAQEDRLVFSTWKDIELKELELKGKNLMFSSFKKSIIENTLIVGSVLLGGNFKEACLTECDLSSCLLENANFKNAKLQNVNFKDSILKGADFTYAELKDVNFEDSNLEKTRFLKKDIPFINLSPFQLQDIVIEEGI